MRVRPGGRLMGDQDTLAAYDSAARSYAAEWEDDQDVPGDLYELLQRFFAPGSVIEVGCGSGRDAAWLAAQGYAVTAFDASEALLTEARRRHPGLEFAVATLPGLREIGARQAGSVLCETVLMHLPAGEIAPAAGRLYELLEPGGTLYVSWRVTAGADLRDPAGRLYSAFEPALILGALRGAVVLYDEEQRSASSGKTVHRVIVRRPG
jgi:SAM-dependent methyltransferase